MKNKVIAPVIEKLRSWIKALAALFKRKEQQLGTEAKADYIIHMLENINDKLKSLEIITSKLDEISGGLYKLSQNTEVKETLEVMNENLKSLETLVRQCIYQYAESVEFRQAIRPGQSNITVFPLEYSLLLLSKGEMTDSVMDIVERYNDLVQNKKDAYEILETIGGVFFNPTEGRETDSRVGGFPFIRKVFYSREGHIFSVLLPLPWDYLSPSERKMIKEYYIVEKGAEFQIKIPSICLSLHKKIYAQGILEIPHGSSL